jgi:membrane-bound lytic murein transglycosylase D
MPTEIALLPMVESAFNPKAYSTSRASGIWQFVPATGKNFGLKQNWWVDNRRDVVAATNAALTYLQKLHSMFGTWDLALAAYNAGEGTVMRAIEKNRKKGLPTDYKSLNLPPETQNYVPKLQAVKNIMSDPAHYGLNVQSIADQPYFTSVAVPQQIDAKLAAKLAGISAEEFVSLNPEYNRPVLTSSPGSAHEILLPVGSDETFTNNLSNYEKPLVSWQTYYAKRGEKQELIARKFGLSLAQLRDVNDLPSKGKLRNGLALLVPIGGNAPDGLQPIPTEEMAASAAVTQSIVEPEQASKIHHTVKKGDSIRSVAKKYGVTSKAIMLSNHMRQATVNPGQVLIVELPTQAKASINKVSMKKGRIAEAKSVSAKIHAKNRSVSSKSKVTHPNTSAKHHAAAKHRA